MTLADAMPLGEARDWLRQRVGHGAHCPCCTQWAQVYRWSLYATAAYALIIFYRLGGTTDFVYSGRLKDRGHRGHGDASRLTHWRLVVRDEEPREDGGKAGYWKVTALGEAFVLNRKTIPKYAYIYDGRCLRFDGPPVTIRDALGKRFNYDELMQGD